MKIYKAKEVNMSNIDRIAISNNAFGDKKGEAMFGKIEEVLLKNGETRNINKYILAIAIINPFMALMGKSIELKHQGKNQLYAFKAILYGMTLSLMLGSGEWNRDKTEYKPGAISLKELFNYDAIQLLDGRKYEVYNLLATVDMYFNDDVISELFNKTFKKGLFAKDRTKIGESEMISLMCTIIELSRKQDL